MQEEPLTLEQAIAQRNRARAALMDIADYVLEERGVPRLSSEARKFVQRRCLQLALEEMQDKGKGID